MTELTKEIMTLDENYVMHTYGRFPIVIEKGEGCYCFDTEGNKYLDLIGGIAVNILGYGDPVLGEAIGKQAKGIIHTSNLFYTIPQPKLAERLTKLAGMRKAFFCNSGAEANEAAIKLARKAAKLMGRDTKIKIVTAYNSFHGRTLGAITATGQEKYQKSFLPLVPGFDYIEYNNIKQTDVIDEDTCAVIMEPIQGESGVHPATKEFLEAVREKCDKYNVALIFDEVQTGMGRTGKIFAYMHYGVKPDILTTAKMIGGGFPMGCCMANEKYMDVFTPGDHASTFGGTPLACTAALTVLDRIEELKLLENCTSMGEYFMESLKTLPHIKEVRGKGLMIGAEFDCDIAKTISKEGFKKGVIMNSIGDRVIRFVPPLIIKKEDIDFAVKAIKAIIEES